MLWRENKNKLFQLTIINYQFPKIEKDYYDSNWLIINIKVKGLRESWGVTDPMLLTFEVKELARWLEDLINNNERSKDLNFIEPNLRFSKIKNTDDKAHIRVYFELEARPKWAYSNIAGKEDLWIDLTPTKNDLKKAIIDLKKQLNKFPIRGK